MPNSRLVWGQLLRFGIVGGVATAVNYGTFSLLLSVTQLHYSVASALGFVAGVLVGYPLNRIWTFAEQSQGSLLKYCLVYTCSLATSLGLLWVLSNQLGLDPRWANILCIAYSTGVNFVGSRWFVFRTPKG